MNRTITTILVVLSIILTATANSYDKARVIIMSDIGGKEPDDQESFIRFLLYANELDIIGIIGANSQFGSNRGDITVFNDILGEYEKIRTNLLIHSDGYPSADYLRSIVKEGQRTNIGMKAVGDCSYCTTEGSEFIKTELTKDDDQPIWFLAWGGINTLSQALWELKYGGNKVSENELQKIIKKIRIYDVAGQDDSGAWIANTFPDIFYLRSGNQFRAFAERISGDWDGDPCQDGDLSVVNISWFRNNVQNNHGEFGEMYPTALYMYEGDSPSFLYLIKNGLNDPEYPYYGSWGGRFKKIRDPKPDRYSDDYEDTEYLPAYVHNNATDTYVFKGKTYKTIYTPLWRWRYEYQNDFAARMDWTIASEYSKANHAPEVMVNDDVSKDILYVSAEPGTTILLDASNSKDPDDDELSYTWWNYFEAGTYSSRVSVKDPANPVTEFTVPNDAVEGDSIHIILSVKDDGDPALTSYKRVVFVIGNIEQIAIASIGSSFTQGAKNQNSYRRTLWKLFQESEYFVDFVGTMNTIANEEPHPNGDFDVDHEGHWEMTTSEIAENISIWLNDYTPNIVLLMSGNTDISNGETPQTVVDNTEKIIESLRAENPSVTILLGSLIHTLEPKFSQTISETNKFLSSLATNLSTGSSKIYFVNHYATLSEDFLLEEQLLDTDGEDIVAENWFTIIDLFYKNQMSIFDNKPTGLFVNSTSKESIEIEWNDNLDCEISYIIERKTDNGEFSIIGSVGEDINTFSDTEIEVNKVYQYRVYAEHLLGWSGYSNSIDVSTAIPTEPKEINIESITYNSVSLSWNTEENTNYIVERSTDNFVTSEKIVAGEGQLLDEALTSLTTYQYKITATNAFGSFSNTIEIQIEASPSPCFVADINYLQVAFSSECSQNIGNATYLWNFGDGSSSNDENPSKTYITAGDYIVSLTITDNRGNEFKETKTISVVHEPEPCIEVTLNYTTVQFSSDCSQHTNNVTYTWDFGDGNNSDEENPLHTYSSEGEYDVSLTITDDNGNDYKVLKKIIISTDPIPCFEVDTDYLIAAFSSECSENTSNATYSWDFGDGNVSDEKNPSNTYIAPGEYTITFTITDNGNEFEVTQTVTIIEEPKPCFKTLIDYLNVEFSPVCSENLNNVSLSWDFGDGTTSNEENPSHLYNEAGMYRVTLIITDSNGNEFKKSESIEVIEEPVPCFEVVAAYRQVDFSSECSDNVNNATYLWDFGDGTISNEENPTHIYGEAGEYLVTLTIYENGNNFIITKKISVIGESVPVPCFGVDVNYLQVEFSSACSENVNNATFTWDFGDGTISNEENPSHIYSTAGEYKVILTIIDNSIEFKTTNTITVFKEPEPCFEVSIENTTIHLSAECSQNTVNATYYWEFGDGSISFKKNPEHIYSTPGEYTVTLTIFDTNKNKFTLKKTIAIFYEPVPCIETTIDYLNVDFSSACSQNKDNATITWDFGDGTTSNEENPSHTYLEEGTYTVILKLSTENGDEFEASNTLDLYTYGYFEHSNCFVNQTILSEKNNYKGDGYITLNLNDGLKIPLISESETEIDLQIRYWAPNSNFTVQLYNNDEYVDEVQFETTTIDNWHTQSFSISAKQGINRFEFFSDSSIELLVDEIYANNSNITFINCTNIHKLQVHAGWNLLSVSVIPFSSDPMRLYIGGTYTTIKNDSFFYSSKYNKQFNRLSKLKVGEGYYFYFNEDAEISIIGIENDYLSPTISYEQGWNIIEINIEEHTNVSKLFEEYSDLETIKGIDGFKLKDGSGTLETLLIGKAYLMYFR